MAASSSGALRDAATRANLRAGGENNCSQLPNSTTITGSSGADGACCAVNVNQPNAHIADLLSTLNLSAAVAKSTQQGGDAPHRDADEDDDVKLDLELLREFVFSGGCQRDERTNRSPIRPIAWRILLGVLDERPAQWQELLAEKRRAYQDWKREFLGCRRQSVVARPPHESSSPSSSSNSGGSTERDAYDQDIALMKEIDKDVSRTQSALPFFAIGGIAQQWMLRILFVYAKLNPELGYMQGMNEILAPIVFVYGSDPNDEWAQEAEANAFYSFSTIMKSVKLLYLKSPTDPLKSGVDTQMTRLTQLLRQHDALLWQHLNSIGLTPDLYSFRWYMTLLTREFSMQTTLRIWDALLADPKRFSFLHYVSCALIRSQRAQLLRDGFSGCLKTLQTLSHVEIERVLAQAEQMREKDRSIDQSRIQTIPSANIR